MRRTEGLLKAPSHSRCGPRSGAGPAFSRALAERAMVSNSRHGVMRPTHSVGGTCRLLWRSKAHHDSRQAAGFTAVSSLIAVPSRLGYRWRQWWGSRPLADGVARRVTATAARHEGSGSALARTSSVSGMPAARRGSFRSMPMHAPSHSCLSSSMPSWPSIPSSTTERMTFI